MLVPCILCLSFVTFALFAHQQWNKSENCSYVSFHVWSNIMRIATIQNKSLLKGKYYLINEEPLFYLSYAE